MTARVDPILLTPEEAAEALAVGRTLVYELIRSGQLASVKIGRARRVPRQALESLVQSLSEAGGQP